ncbi:MAG: diguanylate cyclase [Desulfamplus sp.]|nr:diguanylate cyclase [Desulfamplus sp.]
MASIKFTKLSNKFTKLLNKINKKNSVDFISLKTRVFIIFSLLTLVFLVVDYGIQKAVIFPTYLALEESEALQNMERVSESILREIKHIDILCHDWSSWDDSYEYSISKSQAFEESNLTSGSFISNRINLVYICNNKGDILWESVYDLDSGEPIQMKNILDNPALKKKLVNFSHDSFPEYPAVPEQLTASGIINTEHGLLMIASRPILKSSNQGPARGALMMGRFLDDEFVQKLVVQTKVDFNVISLYEKSNMEKYRQVLSKLIQTKPKQIETAQIETAETATVQTESTQKGLSATPSYYLEKMNHNALEIYSCIFDIENKPAMLISFALPREISKQGMKTISFAIIYILIVGTVVLVIFLLFINKMILNPLLKLKILIQYVENTGDLSMRSTVEHMDEIGILSAGFNRMMEKTESQAKELADSINVQKKEIERRKEAEEDLRLANVKLEELAHLDPLTGIANRRYFGKTIYNEWKRGIREKGCLSIILCDIDYFKRYNDTYGHQQGDECLKQVASAIEKALRRPPDMVARFGGEEFIALLPNTELEGALHIAEQMRANILKLEISHSASDVSDYVSLSLGVASCIPTHETKHEALIEMADKALYKSKTNGRNRVSTTS